MDHLEWLVRSRSDNQLATVALYQTIAVHRSLISATIEAQKVAEELAGVAFSLWRAVFLSDLLAGDEQRLSHLDLFLESLIADNTVVYATDKRSREWTFRYYMSNARSRLQNLPAGQFGDLVDGNLLQRRVSSKKDEWSLMQQALEKAITAFGLALRERAARLPPA